MNDFTKEELRHFDYSLEQFRFSCINPEYEEKIKKLRYKVQSMIDNYCEHDFIAFLQDQNNEPFVDKCMKCHELRLSKD